MLYRQTTEEEKYLKAVSSLPPDTLREAIQRYYFNRAVFLGLPLNFAGSQGAPQVVTATNLNLRQRVAAVGSALAETLEASGRHKAFIEQEVQRAIDKLGGWENVLPTGEWGFLLTYAKFDGDGKVIGFTLDGLPFRFQVQQPNGRGQIYSVDINPANGEVTYNPIGQGSGGSENPL